MTVTSGSQLLFSPRLMNSPRMKIMKKKEMMASPCSSMSSLAWDSRDTQDIKVLRKCNHLNQLSTLTATVLGWVRWNWESSCWNWLPNIQGSKGDQSLEFEGMTLGSNCQGLHVTYFQGQTGGRNEKGGLFARAWWFGEQYWRSSLHPQGAITLIFIFLILYASVINCVPTLHNIQVPLSASVNPLQKIWTSFS